MHCVDELTFLFTKSLFFFVVAAVVIFIVVVVVVVVVVTCENYFHQVMNSIK